MKVLINEINEAPNGTDITSYFCVKRRNSIKEYSRGFMFTVNLVDKSGEITLNYWGRKSEDSVKNTFNSFSEDDVVFVSGKIGEFKGKKIDVNEGVGQIRKAEPKEYVLEDFIVSTNQDIEKMWNEIVEVKNSLTNDHLKKLLDDFFQDKVFVSNFKSAPAAMKIHHSCVGGLLEHTWEVLKYCRAVADVHPSLDKSLLFTGAILHDVGKINSYTVSTQVKTSVSGLLVGHIPIGTGMIREKISKQTNFPSVLKDKIIHMILSHHGKLEYGAVVEPKIPEAAALHHADMISATITQYIRAKKDAKTDGFQSRWNKYIGSVFLE